MDLVDRIDIIEGYNARNLTRQANIMAQRLAAEWLKPVSVGSDAHTPFELCSSYAILEPFWTPGELILNLFNADVRYRKVASLTCIWFRGLSGHNGWQSARAGTMMHKMFRDSSSHA